MNGRRRLMGWGALGCSNLTAFGTQGGVAMDVTKKWGFDSHWQQPTQYEWTEKGDGLGCIGL